MVPPTVQFGPPAVDARAIVGSNREGNQEGETVVRRYVRRMMIVVVTSILAMSLAAATHAQTSKLVVWDWWSPAVMGQAIEGWWEHVIERFEAEHPGVEVEVRFVSNLYDQLVAASAAGVAPDVTQISVSYARDLHEAGLLLPLNNYIDKTPELAQTQFFPFARLFNTKDGVIYAVPHNVDNNSLYYNIDHFDEAGLDSDRFAIDSWATFRDYADKLIRVSGNGEVLRAGYATTIGTVPFQNWLYANGGNFYNETYDGVDFASEHGVEALEFLADMYARGQVAPAGTGHIIASERAAMALESGYGTRVIAENPDARFGMTTLPAGPRGSGRAVTGWVNMIAIPSGAANPDLAWEWIKYFTSLEGQLKFFEIYERAGVPRFDFFETDVWASYTRRYEFIEVLPHLLESAREYPFIKYRDINSTLAPLFASVTQGAMAPKAALEEGERVVNLMFE